MKFLALVAGLLVLAGVVAGVAEKQLRQGRGQKVGLTPTGTEAVGLGRVKLSTQVEGGKLKLMAEPIGGEVPLSAFALKLKVEGGKLVGDRMLVPGGELVAAGWSFPIAKVEEVSGGVEIKLSGVYVSTQKYDLGGSVELGGVAVRSGEGLEFEVDSETTRFFAKDGRRIETEGL